MILTLASEKSFFRENVRKMQIPMMKINGNQSI